MKASAIDDFFEVGGALDPDAPSYVVRRADDDLMRAVLSGQYCNVLTARQMGKSSLMVRTVRRLQDEGIRTVTIDLTGVSTDVSASEWYFGLVSRFKRQLGLSVDVGTWWSERDQLGSVQRFTDFLRQVVLEEIQDSIVVFIDEIDSTLTLPFTDDFFAAIRAAYNARATDPAYKRITFVLLGVARPSDLIKERTRTPYNIGTSIDLTDFTPEEAQVLLAGLEGAYPKQAEPILERVLHWTGGHPYLTQKVCAEVGTGDGLWTDERVDNLVEQLFLTEEARKETNLQFIRDRITESRERGGMLRVYRRVWAGKRVQDEERSLGKSQLKLTGLVKTTADGALMVRNRIYAHVFDVQWVKVNMPVSPAQRLTIAMTAVTALAIIVVAALIYRQRTLSDEVRADLYRGNFLGATSPEVRLNNLAGLFGLDGYEDQVRNLFFNLEADQQLAMFEELGNPEQVGQDVLTVVERVYQDPRLENTPEQNQLLRAMAGVLHQVEGSDVPGAEVTAMEIDYWVAGRELVAEGDFVPAVDQYTLALGLNEKSAAILFDRGQSYAALSQYKDALADLREVLELDPEREDAIQQVIERDSGLFTYVGLHRQEYQAVAAWFPTLTPTPTPTNTPTPTPTPTPTDTPTPTPTSTPTPTNTPTPTPTPSGISVGTGAATVIGRLVWNGRPMAGVLVELRMGLGGPTLLASMVTGTDGRFAFTDLAGAQYYITLDAATLDHEYYGMPWQPVIPEGQITDLGDLNLYRTDLQIVSPLDDEVVSSRTPTFVWGPYPSTVSYRLWVTWPNHIYDGITTTQFTIPQALSPGRYLWSVEAYNASGVMIAKAHSHLTVP